MARRTRQRTLRPERLQLLSVVSLPVKFWREDAHYVLSSALPG